MFHSYAYSISTSVIGGGGYAGRELIALLRRHPGARIHACFGSGAENPISGVPCFPTAELSDRLEGCDVVFLATPPEVSAELVPMILSRGIHAIDLSGAFRLQSEQARAWYGLPDAAMKTLLSAHYGLVPWNTAPINRESPRLIANPGCYATSILMALLPLLRKGLIAPKSVVIDSKSGTTGAGRSPKRELLFAEVDGECFPYKAGRHQHLPEIIRYAKEFADAEIQPFFTPHLLGIRRGILTGIYARTSGPVHLEDIELAYSSAYSDYPLARHGGIRQETRDGLSLRQIAGSPFTQIRYRLEGNQLYVFCLIDNLLKGAASQAIENFNRLFEFPPTAGLDSMGGVL